MGSSFNLHFSWSDLGGSQTLDELNVEIVVLAGLNKVGVLTHSVVAKVFVEVQLDDAPHDFDTGRKSIQRVNPAIVPHDGDELLKHFHGWQMGVELDSFFADRVKSHVHCAREGTLYKLEKLMGQLFLNAEVCPQLVDHLLVMRCTRA